MTSVRTVHDVAVWDHPPHLGPCGTVVLVPGRGEDPRLYERFGARISADAYRVRVVGDPTRWEEDVAAQVKRLRADEDLPRPFVLAGSDAGALFALGLVAGGVVDVDARLLAGLPAPQPGPAEPPAWDEKLEARTACPTHQGRLSAAEHVERGALYAPLPPEWFDRARLAAVRVPVPALHGAADPVSPLEGARRLRARPVGVEHEALARRFATSGIDRFAALTGHTRLPDGEPLLDGVATWMLISLENLIPAGDHQLVIGRVTRAATADGHRPLLYHGGAHHSV